MGTGRTGTGGTTTGIGGTTTGIGATGTGATTTGIGGKIGGKIGGRIGGKMMPGSAGMVPTGRAPFTIAFLQKICPLASHAKVSLLKNVPDGHGMTIGCELVQ